MLTGGSKTLQWGDYLVIVAYFLFVLAVGLWVGPDTARRHSPHPQYCAGVMAVQEEQCRRLLPRLAEHELCAGKRSSRATWRP